MAKLKPDEFKKWLAIYFAEKGNLRYTEKCIEEFGVDFKKPEIFETEPVYKCENLLHLKKMLLTSQNIEEIIRNKSSEYLITNEHIIIKFSWKSEETRKAVLSKFFDSIDKKVTEVGDSDFGEWGINGLFKRYGDSPFKAVSAIYPNVNPWEMKKTPDGVFKEKKNRINVLNHILNETKKDITLICQDDFKNFNVLGLLSYYDGSPYKAALELDPGLKLWQMKVTPVGFYDNSKNRKEIVDWVISKTNKNLSELSVKDYTTLGLRGFMDYYTNSPYKVVQEFNPEIFYWEMQKKRTGFYNDKSNRIDAVTWFSKGLGKPATEITERDFVNSPLSGLLTGRYKNSPYLALLEAGLVTPSDEKYMKSRGPIKSKSN